MVILLTAIMGQVLTNGTAQRLQPNEDHPIQAFVLDRTHKALRESIQIRRSRRSTYNRRPAFRDHPAEFRGVLRVAIEDQIALSQ